MKSAPTRTGRRDRRFVCLEVATGKLRWELNPKSALKASEPGYGFASSPLLLDEWVVLLPAGSSAHSVTALDRRTGARRWSVPAGAPAEYASATAWSPGGKAQVVAQLSDRLIGVSANDGRILWTVGEAAGGLWTPSVLEDGRVFCPTASETRLLAPEGGAARVVWTSPVFEGVMGPVVEIGGMLVGHHKRKLTGIETGTGHQLWQQSSETDGQLLVWGSWLVFVNDRAGKLIVFAADRTGLAVKSEQQVFPPTRMETPLATAQGTLFLRTPTELIALRTEPPPIPATRDQPSP
jgi:outer membrane protein assembly factor BamB